MQQYLQFTDFKAFEKATAHRSKFVKMALRVSVAKVSVLYSFGRSREMQENATPSEETRLLRKERMIDFWRKWLSDVCSNGEQKRTVVL